MYLAHYIGLSHRAHTALADAWSKISEGHSDEADVKLLARRFAAAAGDHARQLAPFVRTESADAPPPENFEAWTFRGPRPGGLGLLRDLHEMSLLVTECDVACMLLTVGAQGVRNVDLLQLACSGQAETKRQLDWLHSRMKQAAPQALVVAD
jgi:hypothetical protein